MKILDAYISQTILRHFLVTTIVLLGLFTFVSFIDNLKDLDKGDFGIFQVLQFVVLGIPKMLHEIFPMAALIGSILGLSVLARDSELIVMRSAGVSVSRITLSVIKVGMKLAFIAVILGEVVSPFTETKAQKIRVEALQSNIQDEASGIWLRDENTYVNIGEVLPDLTLLNLRIFEFDQNNFLRFLSTAEKGTFEDNRWILNGLRRTMIGTQGSSGDELSAAYWSTVVSPEILRIFRIEAEQFSIWQLQRYIDHLRSNRQQTDAYELALWTKVVTPFATIVMLVLAIPFVFKEIRSGSLGKSLFAGIIVGLGFFILNKAFGLFVPLFGVPPILGATIPTIVVSILSVFLVRRII